MDIIYSLYNEDGTMYVPFSNNRSLSRHDRSLHEAPTPSNPGILVGRDDPSFKHPSITEGSLEGSPEPMEGTASFPTSTGGTRGSSIWVEVREVVEPWGSSSNVAMWKKGLSLLEDRTPCIKAISEAISKAKSSISGAEARAGLTQWQGLFGAWESYNGDGEHPATLPDKPKTRENWKTLIDFNESVLLLHHEFLTRMDPDNLALGALEDAVNPTCMCSDRERFSSSG